MLLLSLLYDRHGVAEVAHREGMHRKAIDRHTAAAAATAAKTAKTAITAITATTATTLTSTDDQYKLPLK